MNKQFILLLSGMTGSGKTTSTKILKQKIKRTAIIGLDKIKWFISDFERGTQDNTIAKNIIESMTRTYIDENISIIIEHPITDTELKRYKLLAKEKNIPLYKIQLFTTPEESLKRVLHRQKDMENKVPLERILRNISLFKNLEHEGFTTIDTTNINPENVAEIIFNKIKNA